MMARIDATLRCCLAIAALISSSTVGAESMASKAFKFSDGELGYLRGISAEGKLDAASSSMWVLWNPRGDSDRSALNNPGLRIMFWGRPEGCDPLAADGAVESREFKLFSRSEELTGIDQDSRRSLHWTPAAYHSTCITAGQPRRGNSFVNISNVNGRRGIGLFTFTGPDFNSTMPAFWQARGEAGNFGSGTNKFLSGTFANIRFDWQNPQALAPWSGPGADPTLVIDTLQSLAKLVVESKSKSAHGAAQAKQELVIGFINSECMRAPPQRGACQLKVLFNLAIARAGISDWSREKGFFSGKLFVDKAQGGTPVVFGPVMPAGQSTLFREKGSREMSLWTSSGIGTQFNEFRDKQFLIRISFSQFKNILRLAASGNKNIPVDQVSDRDIEAQFGAQWSVPGTWRLVVVSFGQEVHNPDESSRVYIGGGFKELNLVAN